MDLTSIGGDSEYVAEAAAGSGSGSSVDFNLDDEASADVADASMDFDLSGIDDSIGTASGPATETPLPERVSREGEDLDFDLDGFGDDMLVDSQATPEAPPGAIPEPPVTAEADDGELDFNLDGIGGESAGDESGVMSLDTEFTALDLNLDTAEASADDISQQPPLDLDMDLDAGGDLESALDEASSALGFDIGSDSVDTNAADSPDDALDFGLDLDDAVAAEDVSGGADLNMALDDGELSEETVKLDLGAVLPADDEGEDLDTVKLQSPEMDAADSAISDLGMDLNLEIDAPDSAASSSGVDTAFDGIFDEGAAAAASQDDMALSLDGSDLIPPTPPPAEDDPGEEFPEIDLDFDAEKSQDAAASDEYESTQFMLRDLPGAVPDDDAKPGEGHTLILGGGLTGEVDEVQTKLDLAQAYIDMGDTDGAKGIIDEVLAEGNASQKQAAMGLLSKLASS